jgi:acyl-CoA synthetase (AMP-forming)/AMP-acid ligase II
VVFIDAIPRTSAGKFRKSELRDRYRHHYAMAPVQGSNVVTAIGTD